MSTILVTGATGTLGRAVVQQLVDRGQQVRAYTRQPHPAVPAIRDSRNVVRGVL